MKLLVTGASGFIGRYVVTEALRRGHSVRALIRPATEITGLRWTDHKNVKLVRADLRSKRGLIEAVSGVETVLHLAASQTDDLFGMLTNTVVGTENLLEAMKQAGVGRIVLVSSFAVYDYGKLWTFSELNESCAVESTPDRRDHYCLTKLMQEHLVRAAGSERGLQFTVVRPGAIFGKGHVWTARLGVALSERLWILMGTWAKLPLSYVENCAEAIVMCAEKDEAMGETFNVVDDEAPTQWFYSRQLKQRLTPRPHIVPVPYTLVKTAARIAWFANKILFNGKARMPMILRPDSLYARCKPLHYSNRRLKGTIGWRPRHSLAQGLDRSFASETIDEAPPDRESSKGFSSIQMQRDMMTPALTVVIPTFNRVARLKKTLESLTEQSLDKELFEIVIVDDGSRDGTAQMVTDFAKHVKHHVRYFWQENKSAGTARNLGIMEAKSPIIVLMDDDIIPNKDHLKLHLDLHLRYPDPEVTVRGRITPGPEGVDLLRWEESDILPSGRASGGEPIIGAVYFVTADVSLKKEFLEKAGSFTPELPACQDMDLAWRLKGLGLKLIYCPEALAIHTDPLDSLEKIVRNGKKYGRTLAEWHGRVPLYQKEIWTLGGRFNGGWEHFRVHPIGYLKDSLRRWIINGYTIEPIIRITARIPLTNPPNKSLRRLCREIWAYYYRHEFEERRRQLDKENRK